MAVAIVTGASSGIGLSISRKLVEMGFVVHGLSRGEIPGPGHERLIAEPCDLTDLLSLESATERILRVSDSLDLLVNCAGVGRFGPHETLRVADLEEMVRTNLLAPIVLTRLSLRHLRRARGTVINIASTAAVTPHRFGAAYSATKAGLLRFGESLFQEVRKSGVRVVTLLPDMTTTPFYDRLDFAPDDDPQCHITPECVADAVAQALTMREGTVVTQMTIQPQRVGVKRKGGGCSRDPRD